MIINYVYAQSRIIEQRHQFLTRMRHNRREDRPVVYLDETWANSHDGKERTLVKNNDNVASGTKERMRKPSGKGTRLIILHAGGKDKGADLVFQSKKCTGDYHDEMNAERFEEWLKRSAYP